MTKAPGASRTDAAATSSLGSQPVRAVRALNTLVIHHYVVASSVAVAEVLHVMNAVDASVRGMRVDAETDSCSAAAATAAKAAATRRVRHHGGDGPSHVRPARDLHCLQLFVLLPKDSVNEDDFNLHVHVTFWFYGCKPLFPVLTCQA